MFIAQTLQNNLRPDYLYQEASWHLYHYKENKVMKKVLLRVK